MEGEIEKEGEGEGEGEGEEKEKREAFTLLDERLSFLTYFSGESGSRDITR